MVCLYFYLLIMSNEEKYKIQKDTLSELQRKYEKEFPFTLESTPFRAILRDMINSIPQEKDIILLVGYSSDDIITTENKKKSIVKKLATDGDELLSNKCCYCGERLKRSTFSREHIIPKSKGGKIVKPCCIRCNGEKGDMFLSQFIPFLIQKQHTSEGVEYNRYSKMIDNANRIAKSLNNEKQTNQR